MAGIAEHQSSSAKTDVWLTPPYIIEALGPFDLDPCAAVDQPWATAREHFTIHDNGLDREWNGMVWCNPPYGTKASIWLKRMAAHHNGIALVFARTETKMFFESVWPHASVLLFINGRLNFHFPNGTKSPTNSGAPSVLIGYGREAGRRLESCSIEGAIAYCGPFSVLPVSTTLG